jgi:Amt family ammonium transporter
MNGAFFIGFFGGPLCYGGSMLKHYFGYDDALDAFGVHAVGGIVGGIIYVIIFLSLYLIGCSLRFFKTPRL